MEWADFVEQPATEEEMATAVVAIMGITSKDRGWYTSDYAIVLRSFGVGAHPQCGRALRTLEKQGRIEWENSGRIRLLDRGVDADVVPIRREPPEIHGPFGRGDERPTVAGAMKPSDTTEMDVEVRNVPAPVLNTPEPEKPAQSFQDAVDEVADRFRNDEEPI